MQHVTNPEQMDQIFKENPITPEEREEMLKALGYPDEKKRKYVPQDYQVRRKVFHEGKAVPKGFIFIVIYVNPPKVGGVNVNVKKGQKAQPKRYVAHKMIPSKMGEEFEKGVADALRKIIEDKYDY